MLTKFMAGGMVALVLALGGLYLKYRWDVGRLEGQVVALQNAKIELEVRTKAQEATINFLQKQKTVQTRVIREKSEIQKTVDSGDLDRVRDLYRRYRVPPQDQGGGPGDGRGSRPSNKPAAAPGVG